MDTFGSDVAIIASILIPPLVSGPVVAGVFLFVLKKDQRWLRTLFLVFLILIDLVVFGYMAIKMGDFIGPGFFAWLFTPIAAMLSLLILMIARRRFKPSLAGSRITQRWYALGLLLIPGMQLFMTVAMPLIAPMLCHLGIRTCTDW